jgi:hypothetical protein
MSSSSPSSSSSSSKTLDQTAAGLVRTGLSAEETRVTPAEAEVLRRLAGRVAGLAALPAMAEKRELWRRHNRLEPGRPLVFCDPENGWNEVIPPQTLTCGGTLARSWEMRLRKEIFWGEEMGDDKPIEPSFDVAHVTAADDWGMAEQYHKTDASGSYVWDSPLRDYAADLPRLHSPRVLIDEAATAASLEAAHRLFDGILTVRQKTSWWWSMGVTYPAVRFRGLDTMLYDLVDYPDELKELFRILSQGYLDKLDWLQERGLLYANTDGTYVGSGGWGYTDELPAPAPGAKVSTRQMWGFTESQETVSVSPEMYEEFIFPYETAIMQRFGLTCYGCCEPLHSRWHVVKRHHALRRVSCSPWADAEKMAVNLGRNYIYSMKPNPAAIALPVIDEAGIRAALRRQLEITRGCIVEVIMKDNHTVGNKPQNPARWCRIAREEAERL